jgi:hypothetical protein
VFGEKFPNYITFLFLLLPLLLPQFFVYILPV